MNLASDLMGLGISPLQAARTSNGGSGPLTIAAAGSSFATATRLGATQYFVTCTTAGGTAGAAIALPGVGGDTGALLADDYVINNQTSGQSLYVWCSTGVTISVGGTNTSYAIVGVHTSMTAYPVSSGQWIGVKGS